MDLLTYFLVFIITLIVAFIGAISGGIGLVLRPALIFLGIPAVTVVGTARFSSIFTDLPKIYVFNNHKKIDWKLAAFLVLPMFIGSLLTSIAIVSILKDSFELVIGVLLLMVGTYLLIKKNIGLEEKKFRYSKSKTHTISFLGTAIISSINMITGGMGPVFSSFYIAVYGKTYISASALHKTASYIGAGVASIVFIVAKVIDWRLFFVLVPAGALGSYFGTHHSLKKGNEWVRNLVILIVFASSIKMIFF